MTAEPRFDLSELRRHRVADQCICCGSASLNAAPAVLMPFVAHRALHWAPAVIDESWGLQTLKSGMAYSVCRSLQCDGCGLLFSDIRFSDDELGRLYRDYRGADYTALREKYEPGYTLRNQALQGQIDYGDLLERFLDPLLPNQELSILDYGGDSGKNTPLRRRARQHDVFDISNTPVVIGALAVNRAEAVRNCYDLIVCSNVLEHVPYPSDLLEDIRRVMGPQSLLYVEVPFESIMREYGEAAITHKKHWHEHINFFSPRAISSLLSNVGLKVAAVNTDSSITAGLKSSYMMQVACRRA